MNDNYVLELKKNKEETINKIEYFTSCFPNTDRIKLHKLNHEKINLSLILLLF